MNHPDPLLHHGGLSLQVTGKPLPNILNPIQADITQSSQLDMVGIDAVIEAVALGHTVFSICQHMGITVKAYLHWVSKLPLEDRQKLDGAKNIFYENLERLCLEKMLTIVRLHESIDEDDPNLMNKLAIRDKAMQSIERVLKSVQHTISRQLKKSAQYPVAEASPHTTIIVSNAWLDALPDE